MVLILIAMGCLLFKPTWEVAAFAPSRMSETTFVIDAGHGGEDGGAVSCSGQAECDINLSISKRLDALFHFYGVNTRMVREENISIHDENAKTLREKKRSDIHNRVKLVEEVEGALLISIHQNSFPSPKSHGMQVFFNREEAQPLAVAIQENVRTALDENNHRQALKIPASVYLMKNISCRAVLAECGFLSNAAEAERLQDAGHQKKIAMTIAAACLSEQTA